MQPACQPEYRITNFIGQDPDGVIGLGHADLGNEACG